MRHTIWVFLAGLAIFGSSSAAKEVPLHEGWNLQSACTVTDTLMLARETHPGKKNSLDALCERYAVDHSRRTLHGALLDAQLLADVWLAMTRGQESLDIALASAPVAVLAANESAVQVILHVLRASAAELAEHAAVCARIERESSGRCVWLHLAEQG